MQADLIVQGVRSHAWQKITRSHCSAMRKAIGRNRPESITAHVTSETSFTEVLQSHLHAFASSRPFGGRQ
jgi:hypothetical protein